MLNLKPSFPSKEYLEKKRKLIEEMAELDRQVKIIEAETGMTCKSVAGISWKIKLP